MTFRLLPALWLLLLLPLASRAQPEPWPAGAVPRTPLDSLRYLRSRSQEEFKTDQAAARRTNQQALRLAQRLGDLRLVSDCWRELGDCYDTGQDTEAQRCYEQALAAARQARWPQGMGTAYMSLGLLAATSIHDFARALRFYEQATRQFEAVPATAATLASRARNRLLVLTNQVAAYQQMGDKAAAARLCRQAMSLHRQTLAAAPSAAWRQQFGRRNANLMGIILSLQADLYQQAQQPDSARRSAEQGLRLVTGTEQEADLYINLVKAELAQHQPALAYQHLRPALRLARQGGYSETLQDGLGLLPQILHALHRPEAYDSLQAYVVVLDSAHAHARLEAIAEAQARFDSREQQARILALEQERRLTTQTRELTRLRTQRLLLALGGGAGLLLLLAASLFARYRRRQQVAAAAAEQTLRQQIAADLHDDVGSLLTQVSLQSDLLSQGVLPAAQQPAQLRDMANTSRTAVRHMADVVWGLSQLGHAPTLGPLLDRLRDHAHLVLPPAGLTLDFPATDPALRELPLPTARQQVLYLLYKEALHNTVKHAHGATEVRVRLFVASHQLHLHLRDDGPATHVVPAARPGHGLSNMPARAQAVGGTVRYEAGPGFGVLVSIPLS